MGMTFEQAADHLEQSAHELLCQMAELHLSATGDRRFVYAGSFGGDSLLFTDGKVSPRGKAMLDHTVWRIVNRGCEAAGLGRIRPYDLRHSHASLLIDIGAHPKAISERMGHTEIGVTMNVYGQLFEGKQRS